MKESRGYTIQWAEKCRALLISQGFDLTSYNSTANASDLEDLRLALGYAQWNLYGVSYGTRTALETLRAYPQGIRSVVLDSLLPPQIDRIKTNLTTQVSALETLFAACKADSACNRDYPDLETKFHQLLQQVEQSLIKISVRDPVSKEFKKIWLTSGTVFGAIAEMGKNPAFIQIAPLAIVEIRAGNSKIAERLSTALITGLNQAVYYSVLCQDGGTLFFPHADCVPRQPDPRA